MWAQATEADLLWRAKKNARLPVEQCLLGWLLYQLYPSEKTPRRKTEGVKVQVIAYRLEGVADAKSIYNSIAL